MRDESDGDAEMSDEDQGRAAAPRKRARLGNLNPSSEAIAMMEELQAIMESSTVKRVIKDLDKLPEFKMKIKKRRQQLPTLATGWRTECAEVYSPPRITKIASDMGLRPAWALDLTTVDPDDGQHWDFTRACMRQKALELLERDQPLLVLVSPMCGAFSAMNNINYSRMRLKDIHTKLKAAMQHVRFALELCVRQYDAGRLFLFEHPATATSWSTEMMQQMLSLQGVLTAKFDFCTLGMKTTDRRGEPVAAKKRTTVMTNSSNI